MRELRKLSDLNGYSFQAIDGDIGRLEEVYFDDQHWHVRYFVVRTGNWLLGQQVLLIPAVIGGIDQLSETHKPVVLTRRTDCKHYLTKCLSWYFLRDKNATCDGCKMYEYLELDPMDYVFSNK
jgi:hypothetical protein